MRSTPPSPNMCAGVRCPIIMGCIDGWQQLRWYQPAAKEQRHLAPSCASSLQNRKLLNKIQVAKAFFKLS